MHTSALLFSAIALLAAGHVEAYDFGLDTDHGRTDLTDSDALLDSADPTDLDAEDPRSDLMDSLESEASAKTVLIPADTVEPFDELQPRNMPQKTALMFQPQLLIEDGCHPYPAVQKNGSLNAGFEWSRFSREPCEGSPLGSQVYARSSWYLSKWAIMYAWYFPMALDPVGAFATGHRHYWLWAIVWTSDPNPRESIFLGVSMPGDYGISKHSLPGFQFVSNHTRIKLKSHEAMFSFRQALELTRETGETQDLVMWDQLTPQARTSLTSVVRREVMANPPLQDTIFFDKLEKAYPF